MSIATIINPYDQSAVRKIELCDRRDLDQSFSLARELYDDRGLWLSAHQRANVLEKAARLMEERAASLVGLAVQESGKPIRQTGHDLDSAIVSVRACSAALLNHGQHSLRSHENDYDGSRIISTALTPSGVVAAVSSSLNPFDCVIYQMAPAVAAGCPVVAIPSIQAPLTSLNFADILREAGLPDGWVRCLPVADVPDPEWLSTRSAVLSLTDSPGARYESPLARPARQDRGLASAVVAGDVDIYEVREAMLPACFTHAGQENGAIRRIFTNTRVATRFATQFAMKVSGLVLGDPSDEQTDIGPVMEEATLDQLDAWVREAVDGGAQLLTGGERLGATFYAPTVLFNPPSGCNLMTVDWGGPVVCVVPWFDTTDVVAGVNRSQGPAAIFARGLDQATELADRLIAKAVTVNDVPSAGGTLSALGDLQSTRTVAIRVGALPFPNDVEPA